MNAGAKPPSCSNGRPVATSELAFVVAAFPARRLRHFQKQGSVKEEPKSRRSPVQVELKLRGIQPPKRACFGSPHWKCCSRS